MKMRKIVATLLVLVMAMSAIGCGSKTETTSKDDSSNKSEVKTDDNSSKGTDNTETGSDEKITLRMAWWGSQARHDRTVAVIDLYMSQNPNIIIDYEYYDYESYFNKLNTLVASNTVWDIFQIGSNFPTYANKICYLNKFIEDGTIDVSGTTEAFLRIAADPEGNQAGLCSGVNTYGIAYDPEMFAQAGVPEPTQNWTWDDFATACKTIHDKLGIYGSSKIDDWQAGASMGINQEGFEYGFFNPNNTALGFEDYTMLSDYIQMRKDLVDYGAYPDPGAIAEITDVENDFLVTGEAAMTWVASNQFIALSEAAGKEIKLINPPRKTADGPSGISIQSSQMLSVSKDSEHQAEAAKFIAFFQSNVDANKILLGERGIPTFTAVREALAENLSDAEKAVYAYVDLVGSFDTGGVTVNPTSPACIDQIREKYEYVLDKVIYNEISADEASKQLYDFAKSCEY